MSKMVTAAEQEEIMRREDELMRKNAEAQRLVTEKNRNRGRL